jgi:2,4-dienoyl-CoA reductase-like NADH-dependent reductase (Old Yellow Enzyme family)
MTTKLFTPFKLRDLELTNRIVVAPMCQYAAINGTATDWHIMHLGNFAVSGMGLVITEATGVEPEGRISNACLGLYSDENEQALARIVSFFRTYGGATKFGIQLAHAGRKGSVLPSFLPRRALTAEEGGWAPPSPSDYEDGIHAKLRVLDEAGIAAIREAWKQATVRAERIGIDLIEMHFAHGYLVNQFLSPLVNKRTDRYGGSLANRMRLALELFEDCRALWPAHKPMGVRITATEWVDGGWTLEDSVVLCRELKARGCDYICCTSGGTSLKQDIKSGPLYQVPFAERIRRECGIPTMAVGQIWEPHEAESVLREDKADLIAIGRRMLYDPRWAWHAAIALGEFIPFAPRYRTCHPMMGTALKFAESPEMRKAIEAMWQAEADHERRHKASVD